MNGVSAPLPTLPAPRPPDAPKDASRDSAAARTAREFEAVFLGQMTQLMMESAPADGEFSGGHGEQMFRGVLAEKLGAAIAARGGVGIAPAVMDQIIALQGGSPDGQ